jgi:hypothetical protein
MFRQSVARLSPYYDIILPTSVLQAGLGAVQTHINSAGIAGGLAGTVAGAIGDCWTGILINDVQNRQVNGQVCLRLKWHNLPFGMKIGPSPEIGAPSTAYYRPSGGNDPNSAP